MFFFTFLYFISNNWGQLEEEEILANLRDNKLILRTGCKTCFKTAMASQRHQDDDTTGPHHNCTNLQRKIEALEQKIKLYEKLGRFTEEDSLVNHYGNKVRQNILVISNLYCGSSFLGEIFNQHPQVFYLHEPVDSLEYYRENRPENVYDTMVTHLLNGIFHCDFRELAYFTDFISLQYSSIKHRLSSRALSSPPLCPVFTPSHPLFNIRMCTRLRPQTLSAICSMHRHTVVKTVQVDFIHKLSYLMDTEGPADYALKVVHLVRDPRALIDAKIQNDIKSNWTTLSLRKNARAMCKDLLLNIKYAVSAPPWLQGRYTLLRYEDLATKPHQITEQLYQFVGINIDTQVRRWLDKRSTTVSFSGMSALNPSGTAEAQDGSLSDKVFKWRERMPYSVVRIIETECYEVMNLLGYKIVDDMDELRATNIPLMD